MPHERIAKNASPEATVQNQQVKVLESSSLEALVDDYSLVIDRKFRGFLAAGMADAHRISHSLIGMGSLLVGYHHMMEICIWQNNFALAIGTPQIFATGMLHSTCGLLGVRRLHWDSEKEAARNAMMWPAPIQNLWFLAASLSEWGQGPDAIVSMFDSPFYLFTAFNLFLTFWQLHQVQQNTGPTKTKDFIWLDQPWKNAVLVECAYLMWMQVQLVCVLYLATFCDPSQFSAFMDDFPDMHHLLANLALNTAFFNNLVVFLATLLRYKLVAKPSEQNAVVFSVPILTSMYIVWKVLFCFFGVRNGEMSHTFLAILSGTT